MLWNRLHGLVPVLLALVSSTSSQATYTPVTSLSYSLALPGGSSSTSPLYIQLKAPTTYQWVGLGTGSQMDGSTMFIMYQDGNGNVTLSVRDGTGHNSPSLDTTLMQGLEVLEGTGVVNGMMVGNLKCTGCSLDSSSSSSSAPFIAAWNVGSSLASTSTSKAINQHGGNSYRMFTFNPSVAVISSDSNPFLSSSTASTTGTATGTSTGSSSTSTNSGSSSSGSGDGDGDGDGDGKHGNSGSSNDGSTTTGTGASRLTTLQTYQLAHGVVMGVAVVLLFPIGAIFMRSGIGGVWLHGIWQLISLVAVLVGFGLGVKLAKLDYNLFKNTHTIFGAVITALFLIQPLLGLIHHILYRRNLQRNPISHIHIWFGRILMLLAIVNGGLGLQLVKSYNQGKWTVILYSVVAAVVGVIYIVLVVFKRKKPAGSIQGDRKTFELEGRIWRDRQAGSRWEKNGVAGSSPGRSGRHLTDEDSSSYFEGQR